MALHLDNSGRFVGGARVQLGADPASAAHAAHRRRVRVAAPTAFAPAGVSGGLTAAVVRVTGVLSGPTAWQVNGAAWTHRLVVKAKARRPGPSRGGDGGLLGGELREQGNGRISLTCAPAGVELVATRDPADRAHRVREWNAKAGWMYVSAADGRGLARAGLVATARRYPRSSMTLSGVAFDSMFDETHERQLRLAGVSGISTRSVMADLKYRPQRNAAGVLR